MVRSHNTVNKIVSDCEGEKIVISVNGHYLLDQRTNNPLMANYPKTQTFVLCNQQMPSEGYIALRFDMIMFLIKGIIHIY